MTAEMPSSQLDVDTVTRRLRRSWSSESSSQWRPDNPALGQCNVTALVIHDHFGGDILKTPVGSEWHFYNRIDGRIYDFTAEQFASPPDYRDLPSDRDEALAGTAVERYEALARRFTAITSNDI
jgi:hypothetical protein